MFGTHCAEGLSWMSKDSRRVGTVAGCKLKKHGTELCRWFWTFLHKLLEFLQLYR